MVFNFSAFKSSYKEICSSFDFLDDFLVYLDFTNEEIRTLGLFLHCLSLDKVPSTINTVDFVHLMHGLHKVSPYVDLPFGDDRFHADIVAELIDEVDGAWYKFIHRYDHLNPELSAVLVSRAASL